MLAASIAPRRFTVFLLSTFAGCALLLALVGLRSIAPFVNFDMDCDQVKQATAWLRSVQNADGGWGETCESYKKPELRGVGPSTPSQTAWALLGLMAAVGFVLVLTFAPPFRSVRLVDRLAPYVHDTPPPSRLLGSATEAGVLIAVRRIFGPVVGAFIIIAMQQYLAGFGQWVTVIQGVIFVACVLAFRRGIVGEFAHYLRRSL